MKIAAASCANLRQKPVQPAWNKIRNARPDAVLLLGDNVYLADDGHTTGPPLLADLKARYTAQFKEPNYKALVDDLKRREAPLIPVYDDHDFLGNDRCGAAFPAIRDVARAEFVRRYRPRRTGDEVYSVRRMGLVDVVALDVRYHREPPGGTSDTDKHAILGKTQWIWLEDTLAAASDAAYTIVMSGTTFHDFRRSESWARYPAAHQRLAGLLAGRAGTMVLSGDIHRNAWSNQDGVLEVVTSGVARRTTKAGVVTKHGNHAVLTFDEQRMGIELRRRGADTQRVRAPLSGWQLTVS